MVYHSYINGGEILTIGENETLEFKSGIGQLDKGLLSLTAMLNRHGRGTVLIGVDDGGEIIGMDIGKDTVEKIRNKIGTLIKPQIVSNIEVKKNDDGKEYISISAEGRNTPYSFDGRYYIRNISSNEQASPEIMKRMLMSGNSDILRGRRSPVSELTFETFTSFVEMKGIHYKGSSDFFESHGMLTDSGEYNMVAYLMSDQNDFPMQIVTFDGKKKGVMSKRIDFGHRCILVSLQAMIDHISSLNDTNVNITESTREEEHLFDIESLRESLVNACVHNDWNGMLPPSVFIYDDRIEVQSYGNIPIMLSLEEFYRGKSMPVNKSLFELFVLLRYSEQSGNGVPVIVKRYGKESIDIGGYIITVNIPFSFKPYWVMKRESKSGEIPMNDTQMRILAYLETHRYASIKEISDEIGLSIPGISKNISLLKSMGILVNEGNNRRNVWMVTRYING